MAKFGFYNAASFRIELSQGGGIRFQLAELELRQPEQLRQVGGHPIYNIAILLFLNLAIGFSTVRAKMQPIALLILVDIIALPAYNNNRRQQCLKIVPAPRYAADKWSGSQILPLPGMRLINGWDKNVCRASSKDGALHLWEVFMLDAQLYFLSDQYYIDFPDDKLMQNKDMIDGIRRSRPCFLAFPDSKNPSIYWLVPISSRYEKYQKIAQSKIEKYGRCNTIRFGTVLGRNAAFLIQNMCPVTEFYLTAYIDKNKVPIRLDDRIVEDVTKNAREVLAIARRGAKVIFPDVFKLYQELEKTL